MFFFSGALPRKWAGWLPQLSEVNQIFVRVSHSVFTLEAAPGGAAGSSPCPDGKGGGVMITFLTGLLNFMVTPKSRNTIEKDHLAAFCLNVAGICKMKWGKAHTARFKRGWFHLLTSLGMSSYGNWNQRTRWDRGQRSSHFVAEHRLAAYSFLAFCIWYCHDFVMLVVLLVEVLFFVIVFIIIRIFGAT